MLKGCMIDDNFKDNLTYKYRQILCFRETKPVPYLVNTKLVVVTHTPSTLAHQSNPLEPTHPHSP